METNILDIPLLEKSKVSKAQPGSAPPIQAATSCCTPSPTKAVCCTPSQTSEENDEACCAQPTDGSACCEK